MKTNISEIENKVKDELKTSADGMLEKVEDVKRELFAFCEIKSLEKTTPMQQILLHSKASKIEKQLNNVLQSLEDLIESISEKKKRY